MPLFTLAVLRMLIPSLIALASGIVPLFTSKKATDSPGSVPDPGHTQAIASLQSQIGELQTAVTSQGQALHDLSKELQNSLTAIAASFEAHEKRLKQQFYLSFSALSVGLLGIVLAFVFHCP